MKEKILKHLNLFLVGGITVLFLAAIQIFCYAIPSDTKVPIWVIIIILFVFYLIITIVYALLRAFYENKTVKLEYPKVLSISREGNAVYIVQKYNQFYTRDSYISVYYKDSETDVETFIGIGEVTSEKIEKNNTQIRIDKFFNKEQNQEKINQIMKNTRSARRSLITKTNIDLNYVNFLYTEDK